MGISQSLPESVNVKMVDVWMIFTISYPFFVIACHSAHEVANLSIKLREKNVLPVFGALFALVYFSISLQMYNNPHIEMAAI